MQAHGPITSPRSYQGLLHLIILHESERYSVVTHSYYDRHIGCWVLVLATVFCDGGGAPSLLESSPARMSEFRVIDSSLAQPADPHESCVFCPHEPQVPPVPRRMEQTKSKKMPKAWTVPPPAPHYFESWDLQLWAVAAIESLHPNILLEGFAGGFWGVG